MIREMPMVWKQVRAWRVAKLQVNHLFGLVCRIQRQDNLLQLKRLDEGWAERYTMSKKSRFPKWSGNGQSWEMKSDKGVYEGVYMHTAIWNRQRVWVKDLIMLVQRKTHKIYESDTDVEWGPWGYGMLASSPLWLLRKGCISISAMFRFW